MVENSSGMSIPRLTSEPDVVRPLPELHYERQLNVTDSLVDRHVREGRGDDAALLYEDDEITYAELRRRVTALGNALANLGVEPGDRVVTRLSNRPEAIVACLAIQRIGAVAVPTMKLLREAEFTDAVTDTEAVAVVVEDTLVEEVADCLPTFESVEEVVLLGDDVDGLDHQSYEEFEHRSYDEIVARADDDPDDPYPTARDDVALMLYTSGTTGKPKGALHTHEQILATADSYARYCLEPTREDVFGGNAPLPFAYGYGCFVTFPLRFGATASIAPASETEPLLEAIATHEVSIVFSVPTSYKQLLSVDDASYDTSSLRLGVSAGEPLSPTTFEQFQRRHGVELLDGLGTTEMLHIFVSHRAGEEIAPATTGYAVPGYECRVVDPETKEELDRGESGLLAVRGPTAIQYHDRPDEQTEAVEDGWNYTGDVFVHREDGRLAYKGRRDDLITSGGHRISAVEVETVLDEHDAVAEVAVVGVPDPKRGEIVKAFVIPATGVEVTDASATSVEEAEASATGVDETGASVADDLQRYVKQELAPYKYPREVEFVERLPRTDTGKVRREVLAER